MFRRLFHILAALSFVLMIIACAAWVRSSAGWSEHLWYTAGNRETVIGFSRGKLEFANCFYRYDLVSQMAFDLTSEDDASLIDAWDSATAVKQVAGFDYYGRVEADPPGYDPFSGVTEYHIYRIPLWFAVLLFAMLPLLWFRALMRRRRVRQRVRRGLCIACGYDLQGSPGRCPECGSMPLTSA